MTAARRTFEDIDFHREEEHERVDASRVDQDATGHVGDEKQTNCRSSLTRGSLPIQENCQAMSARGEQPA
jgi:hypothetical protein